MVCDHADLLCRKPLAHPARMLRLASPTPSPSPCTSQPFLSFFFFFFFSLCTAWMPGLFVRDSVTDAKQGPKVEAPIILALGLITGTGLLHKSHRCLASSPMALHMPFLSLNEGTNLAAGHLQPPWPVDCTCSLRIANTCHGCSLAFKCCYLKTKLGLLVGWFFWEGEGGAISVQLSFLRYTQRLLFCSLPVAEIFTTGQISVCLPNMQRDW